MSLTFVIPTFNRPKELRACVVSIARQITEDVQILIIDNGSSEETGHAIGRLQSEYSFVQSQRFEDNIDYSVSFKRMMEANPDSEWVWTFGDDDFLMSGALSFMLEQLSRFTDEGVQFIHVAEVNRASGTNGCYRGSLLDLCSEFGWLEMTGFITGNIIKANRLHKAANTPRWNLYAKSAFVHSCALLEELKDSPCAFLDLPLINTQNKEQTQEGLQGWIREKIPERYLYVSDAIERMFEDSVLENKLPPKFFRYLTYHLWDRFLVHSSVDYSSRGAAWTDQAWASVLKFANFINDEQVIAELNRDVEAARGMTTLHFYLKQNLEAIMGEITGLSARREQLIYPYTFTQPKGAKHGEETEVPNKTR